MSRSPFFFPFKIRYSPKMSYIKQNLHTFIIHFFNAKALYVTGFNPHNSGKTSTFC